ncbi:bifunctional glycosyltransferase family 2 protein/CDP-glycerol:glycerophosphate glycerophosphotransferase [Capillimicrobium parvum]|nr:bifunctional glycosyltransferase family 2 protein/CDP-glycerol:glycerophosphate glycerophosphotransferase [Capillimicrobium parvum]
MIRVSFLLVVHREQAYVAECVRSVLREGGDDVELVAIDDASPDHGPEVLDQLAAEDPRVRVRHLPQRIGLGASRDLALSLARGRHVWCIDTTGALALGGLAPVVDQLDQLDPDVLIVDHDLVTELGAVRPARRGEQLAALAARGPHELAALPAAAALASGAWDKVLRTQLLRDLGMRFGTAGHSELSVTWPALIAADRIAASPAAAYVRREAPNAVRDALTTGSAGDALDQHDEVWSFLLGHGRRAALAPVVREALLRQALGLLEAAPPGERAALFARISAAYRDRGGSGRTGIPRSVPELRTRLVSSGHHRSYEGVARSAAGAKVAVARARRVAARGRGALARAERVALRRHYRRSLRAPIDPELAVFAAYWYRGYQCNPRAVYEEARRVVPSVRGVWVVTADAAASLPAGLDHVVDGTPEYYDVLARAAVLVNNVNFPNDVVKRPGAVHLMTHHGTPLKRMGTDVTTGPRDLAPLLRRVARWDYSVSSNPFSTVVVERVFPGRYATLEVGYPRNDVLARAGDPETAAAREALGILAGQRVVLHAPTHRDYRPDWAPTLDVAALAEALGPDVVVLDRRHYLYGSRPGMDDLQREGRVRDVSGHPSIEQLCLASDLLISDYSSIVVDYAVLDRPMVIHAPDWEVYRTMRGTYYDLVGEPPGVVTTTLAEVIDAVASGAFADEPAERRRAFRERFCPWEDGRAAERVVGKVWLGEEPIAPRTAAAP